MPQVIDIPEMFSTLTARVNTALSTRSVDPFNVFYDFGREVEVTRNLSSKDQGITTKGKKYPLIWIVIPYTVVETMIGEGCEIRDLQIIIATATKQASTSPERIAANFIPRLYPIYDELRKQIINSGFFEDLDFDNTHTRKDQPYWDGKNGSPSANLFNDFIDAIQLNIGRLRVSQQTCNRFRLIGA